MLSLLGVNHRLPLCYISKRLFGLMKQKNLINEFKAGYMINPNSNINKAFREQVDICMKTAFSVITQPHIRATLSKN